MKHHSIAQSTSKTLTKPSVRVYCNVCTLADSGSDFSTTSDNCLEALD